MEPALLTTRARRSVALVVAICLAAVGLVVAAPSSARADTAYEVEDNGSLATANALPLGTTITGASLTAYTYDYDYYQFTLPSRSRINLSLTFPAGLPGNAYAVDVYDANGTRKYSFQVLGSESSGAWAAGYAMYLPAGAGYVRIYGSKSQAIWGQEYNLTVTATPGTVESPTNDDLAHADALPLGTTVKGSSLTDYTYDYDYYQFTLASRSRLNLSLTFPSGLPGDAYAVSIYDAGGTMRYSFQVLGSESSGAWAARYAAYMPAGAGYVRIYGYKSLAIWGKEYSLKVTATPGTVESPTNDDLAHADSLPVGTTIKGSSLTASTYDYDYFYFPLAATTRVGIRLVSAGGLGGNGYTVALYDSSGRWLYSTTTLASKTTNDIAWTIPAGGGYVQIYGYKGLSTWGKEYQLSVLRGLTAGTPTISGTAKVGKTLTAKPGTWGPSGTTLKYQWYRSGKAIKGATTSKYKLVAADAGRAVTVKVTGSRSGYIPVSKTSAARTVAKLSPKVGVTVPASVSHTARGKVTVKVTTAATAKPTGTVKVTVGGKSVSKKVTASAKGRTTITLPKITKKGTYKVTVTFTPSGSTATSTAAKKATATLKVR